MAEPLDLTVGAYPKPAEREVECFFHLHLPGLDGDAADGEFRELWFKAAAWRQQLEDAELKEKAAQLQKRKKDHEKTKRGRDISLIYDAVRAEIDENAVGREEAWLKEKRPRLEKLGMLEFTEKVMEDRRREEAFSRDDAILDAAAGVSPSLDTLIREMQNGSKLAAELLCRQIRDATALLQLQFALTPGLFQEWTKYQSHLPVLASLDPSWKMKADQLVQMVGLGSALAESKFKPVAYMDSVYVCRKWARATVRCLDRNRHTLGLLGMICDFLKANSAQEPIPALPPEWVIAASHLPPFCRTSAKDWSGAARAMIRHQCPDFDQHPDFERIVSDIRRRFVDPPARSAKRTGTIQNGILDKIAETMETISSE